MGRQGLEKIKPMNTPTKLIAGVSRSSQALPSAARWRGCWGLAFWQPLLPRPISDSMV
jgi:hypothetical protein